MTVTPKVDVGILTIREDEFSAVLEAFPDEAGILERKNREYTLRHADISTGERYLVAVLRQAEQGNGEAQSAARDLIEDLAPKLILSDASRRCRFSLCDRHPRQHRRG